MKKETKKRTKKADPANISGFRIIKPVKIASEKIEVRVETPEKVEVEIKKAEVLTIIPIPQGCVRCRVLKDYDGMLDDMHCGDIVDLPERRYKSLSFRGLVEEYKGGIQPNKRR